MSDFTKSKKIVQESNERFWRSESEEQTRQIGRSIGENARPGHFICLIGNLGAGKTAMAKGIGGGMGLNENDISSPSFSLIAEHRANGLLLVHFDVYRLSSGADLDDIGFTDYLNADDCILVVEWADRIADCLPDDCLTIEMKSGSSPEVREIRISASGESSSALLSKLS